MKTTRHLVCAFALFGAAIGDGVCAEESRAEVVLAAEAPSPRTSLGISALLVIGIAVMLVRRRAAAFQ